MLAFDLGGESSDIFTPGKRIAIGIQHQTSGISAQIGDLCFGHERPFIHIAGAICSGHVSPRFLRGEFGAGHVVINGFRFLTR
jgi:hypothetical protein